jgi:hypothetical protein
VRKAVGRGVRKAGTKPSAQLQIDIAKANAKFDRLLDAMAKTPELPKKKKRVVVRQTQSDVFDD